jgi:hypothetical protein
MMKTIALFMINLCRRSLLACAFLAAASLLNAQSLDSEQALFLTLINNYRAQNGVGPLQVSPKLQQAAQWMSSDLAAKNYFSHTDSLGRDPFQRMAAFGYSYYPAGENIAAGNSGAQATFNQWQASSGHNQNMLNPGYKAIGIGRAYNANSTYRWYWTTDFGGVVDGTVNPPTTPPPAIGFFSASPSVISRGQTVTLMWSVSSATSIAIDNGIGDVSRLSSVTVTPQATTTYRLTATNAGGSVTSAATVTVNVPNADTQAPTAPATMWASPASSTEVSLQWNASTDNVGVIGYQVFRNGAVLTAVSGATTSYVDRTAAGGTSYVYSVRAYDAAGNYSGQSPNAQVTTPGSTQPTPASVTAVSGSSQTAVVAKAFAAPLRARVLDAAGRAVAGVTVTFTAPTSGATAMFTGSGNVATVRTDSTGVAQSPVLIANGTAGTYIVSASVPGVAPAVFTLTNTASTTPPPPSGALSLWANTVVPNRYIVFPGPVELGVKFRSDISGKITGVRFYKHYANGGTHTGSLWSADGKLLATGTFTSETAGGWQTLTFSTPIAISANTTYVASYRSNSGVSSVTLGQFSTAGVDNGTLHALRHGASGPNGVFVLSSTSKFPAYGSGDNYWVDVVFVK